MDMINELWIYFFFADLILLIRGVKTKRPCHISVTILAKLPVIFRYLCYQNAVTW